jgi:hypothetical protein
MSGLISASFIVSCYGYKVHNKVDHDPKISGRIPLSVLKKILQKRLKTQNCEHLFCIGVNVEYSVLMK